MAKQRPHLEAYNEEINRLSAVTLPLHMKENELALYVRNTRTAACLALSLRQVSNHFYHCFLLFTRQSHTSYARVQVCVVILSASLLSTGCIGRTRRTWRCAARRSSCLSTCFRTGSLFFCWRWSTNTSTFAVGLFSVLLPIHSRCLVGPMLTGRRLARTARSVLGKATRGRRCTECANSNYWRGTVACG